MTKPTKQLTFDQVISALMDMNTPFPPTYLHRFSDMAPEDLARLKKAWPQVNTERRVAILLDLEELADSDTLVDFEDVGRFALADSDPRARAVATRLLWEAQDADLAPIFINMVKTDPDPIVRSSAATSLGLFTYLGELEEIPETLLHQVEESLISTLKGTDADLVRRRALEALGFSGRPEVPGFIKEAFENSDPEWKSSALFAMGRSADASWEEQVMSMITDPDPNIQVEAVRAAGQLSIAAARPYLLEMLEDPDPVDEDVFAAAIWALSEIGGEEVQAALEALLETTEDEDEISFIENAIDNLEFTNGFPLFDLMDVEDEAEKDLDNIIDLEADETKDDEDEEEL